MAHIASADGNGTLVMDEGGKLDVSYTIKVFSRGVIGREADGFLSASAPSNVSVRLGGATLRSQDATEMRVKVTEVDPRGGARFRVSGPLPSF